MTDSGEARLVKIHALSGIFVALFASLHIMNQAAAFSGPDAYNAFRSFLRRLYQYPAYEIVFLTLPILFNTASGLYMARRRQSATRDYSLRRRLHRWSGISLAALLLPHALSTRGLDLVWDLDVGFHFVAGTMSGFGGIVFASGYALLTAAASFHLCNGLFTFLDESGCFPGRVSRRAAAAAMTVVGAILIFAGMLGLLSCAGIAYPAPNLEPLPLNR